MPREGVKGGKYKVGKAPTTEVNGFQTCSGSAKAGLQLLITRLSFFCVSVTRVHRYLKQCTQNNVRIGAKAAIYTSAILEYLTAEVLEVAGPSSAFLSSLLRISASSVSHHSIYNSLFGDEALDTLVRATIAGGGVVPFIHNSLTVGKMIKKPEGPPAA
ncbi:histone 2A [Lactarius deliciosus]|nr:histone 2A [Lactarius deliciosus]